MPRPTLKFLPCLFAGLTAAILPPLEHGRLSADDSSSQKKAASGKLLERGKTIFAESCASCHGAGGQGVEDAYAEPLVGDLSIPELSKRIADTMPEGEPERCVGADADAVAAYIHETFYSEEARTRNDPPRIRLTHLTGAQLRQSVADLYGRFSGAAPTESKRGIQGEYYEGDRARRNKRKIERADPRIDFDWKRDGPGEGVTPQEFLVRWRGGLKVDGTGRYEIVVRSTCAFHVNLGSYDREFINNRVQSGDKTEFRKSIVLTGGRVYPIEIELIQRKRKTEQPPARISLSWVPPHGVEEVVPERSLLPVYVPAAYSLQMKLPPDDRSYGYERGLAVDREWDASTTAAAVEFADIAVAELWPDYRRKHRKDSDKNRARLRNFLAEIVETAFRGPLDEHTRRFYIDEQVDKTEDDAEAIKRSVLATLKSPRFLYPELDQDRSASQQAANSLALTLFDSLPSDEWLIKLAREDKLKTPDQVCAAAERMVGDYRNRGKTRELLYEWLNLGHIGEITKSSNAYPDFNPNITADLRASLDAFLDDVVWGETSDYRQLFLADRAYTTPRLHDYYGPAWKPDGESHGGLSQSVAAPQRRFGVLSHPYLMSGLAYQDATSPIHRGVFLVRYVLGRTLNPPKEAFTPFSPDLHPNLTTRERVQLQTGSKTCQVCHSRINGLGFALENFDAVGRFREKEGDKPIDSTGSYTTRAGDSVVFQGPAELAEFLAGSDDAHRAFVRRTFQHFVKQPTAAYGPGRLTELAEKFRNSNFSIRKLLVEVAAIAALHPLESPETASSRGS